MAHNPMMTQYQTVDDRMKSFTSQQKTENELLSTRASQAHQQQTAKKSPGLSSKQHRRVTSFDNKVGNGES